MAMTITEMLEKRARLWEQTKKFLEDHTDKDGKMAAADVEAYEKMEADIAEMGKTIARLEKQAEMDKKLAMPTSKPLMGNPGQPAKKGTASDEYRNAMFTAIRTKFRVVSNVLQEGIDESGGYLVPDEYDRRLVQALEIMFMLLLLGENCGGGLEGYILTYIHSVLILAFMSLFANLIGFLPLQLGVQEGGFVLSIAAMGLAPAVGIFVSIICRVREIIWIAVGVGLMKLPGSDKD